MGIFLSDKKEVNSIFASVPLPKVEDFSLYGKATQNGTPTPDAPVEIEVAGESYNLLENTGTSKTSNGVTFTVNEDKSVTVNGTASADTFFNISTQDFGEVSLSTYGTPTANGYTISSGVVDSSTTHGISYNKSNKITAIVVKSGVKVDNKTFYPMVRLATVKSDTYIPYGSKSVTVTSVGKNFLKYPYQHTTRTINGVTFTVNNNNGCISVKGTNNGSGTSDFFLIGSWGVKNNIDLIPKEDLIISGIDAQANVGSQKISIRTYVFDGNGKSLGGVLDWGSGVNLSKDLITPASGIAVYIVVNSGVTVDTVVYPMIRLATDTDSTYEPYKEVTATILTPDGLAGIPVESGGNYTDSNGQEWVCDEIVKYGDGSGEYIQRVDKTNFTNATWKMNEVNKFYTELDSKKYMKSSYGLCSHLKSKSNTDINNIFINSQGAIRVNVESADIETTKTIMENVVFYGVCVEPIHTPLTAEEIAEIEKLAAVYPANNVTTTDDCGVLLTFGRRYEKKKIVSVWANKDGSPAKVFVSKNGRFVTVGSSLANGNSYYSRNGEAWQPMTGLSSTTFYGVTYGNGKFVAVGISGAVCYSNDGETWTSTNGIGTTMYAVTYGKDRFVTVGANGESYYSTDGDKWYSMSGLSTSVFYGVTYANGRFVTVGANGKSYFTTDGSNWSTMSALPSSTFRSVAYGNNRLITVGDNGTAYYSTNGTTWNIISGSGTGTAYSVTYGKDRFVTVGANGKSYYTTDGVTWVAMTGLPSKKFNSVTFGNGRFVAVGESGETYYSRNGEAWQPMTGLDTGNNYIAVCYSIDGGYGE